MWDELKNYGFLGVFLLSFTTCSFANYRAPSENAELLEDAQSGGAAIAIDASTNFFNPGGITRIPNQQLVFFGKAVQSNIRFSGTSAGSTGVAKSNVAALVPAFHYSTPIYQKWFFGFSMNSPFGSATKYPMGSIVQYVGTETSLVTINFGPSLAYRFNPHFSLGAGPDAQYGRIIADAAFPPPSPFPIPVFELKNRGADWAFGWHAGALYEINEKARIGLSYRSQMRHRFNGKSSYPGLPTTTNFSVALPLPPITLLSAYYRFNSPFALMATIEYTQWSILQNIVAKNTAVAALTGNVVFPQNFKNTTRYALGGEYHYGPQWIFRAGASWLPTPMNNVDRNVTLPVTDSIVASIGGHYQMYRNIGFDIGYTHLFIKRANINNTTLGVTTVGTADSSINVVGAQVTWDI